MKKSRFTESQIFGVLKEQEQGKVVSEICRFHGISQATFYKWKSKYSGMEASDIKRIKELEAENSKLKRMYAERSMEVDALKDVLSKKW
jgi:putative transposase